MHEQFQLIPNQPDSEIFLHYPGKETNFPNKIYAESADILNIIITKILVKQYPWLEFKIENDVYAGTETFSLELPDNNNTKQKVKSVLFELKEKIHSLSNSNDIIYTAVVLANEQHEPTFELPYTCFIIKALYQMFLDHKEASRIEFRAQQFFRLIETLCSAKPKQTQDEFYLNCLINSLLHSCKFNDSGTWYNMHKNPHYLEKLKQFFSIQKKSSKLYYQYLLSTSFNINKKMPEKNRVEIIAWGGQAVIAQYKNQKDKVIKISINELNDPHAPYDNMQSEAAILQKLNHPNIIKPLIELENSKTSITLPFYSLTLKGYLRRPYALLPTNQFTISLQILQALKYLHANDIAHNDVKLSNVLIGSNNKAVLADFGSAVDFSNDEEFFPAVDPSLCDKHSNDDESFYFNQTGETRFKADIYAFSFVLYAIATGIDFIDLCETSGMIGSLVEGTIRPNTQNLTPLLAHVLFTSWAIDHARRNTSKELVNIFNKHRGSIFKSAPLGYVSSRAQPN